MTHQGSPKTVAELRELPLDDVPPQLANIWHKVQPTKVKKSDWNKNTEVYYIYGKSGTGKSTLAKLIADEEFDKVKHVGDFWSQCSGEGCCIYDDFRASHMTPSEFINFIDYRSHMLNIKGGAVRNCYTKIIITSIQSPYEIYTKFPEEGRKQWLRRLRIVKTDILNKHG